MSNRRAQDERIEGTPDGSNAISEITDIPDAPTIGTATAGLASASVAFTPATTGGTASLFTATSSPGSITGTSATSPITVSGLTAGTAYTFTVRGSNSTGSGASSSASNSATPIDVPGSYDALATVTVPSGGAASVTFSGIPTGYKHLQIRVSARDQGTGQYDDVNMRLNSDSEANYTIHQLKGTGSTTNVYQNTGVTSMQLFPLNSNSSASNNANTVAVIDILDYTSTNKYKTVKSLFGWDGNGAGDVGMRSSVWLNTAAVSTITFTNNGSVVMGQYSSFALFGVK